MAFRNSGRPDRLRAVIADEAARIMLERGLSDFKAAKAKAVERLGLGTRAPLPGNGEIEAALAERNRIFRSDSHPQQLLHMRQTAAQLMNELEAFEPRLVGSTLSGHATTHSTIDLHLFTDTSEIVGERLDMLGIAYRAIQIRYRWKPGQTAPVPGVRFYREDFECIASIFPEKQRAHPPLSPVDGRPMRRASLRQVSSLLGG